VLATNLLSPSPDQGLDCGRGLSPYCLTFARPSVFEHFEIILLSARSGHCLACLRKHIMNRNIDLHENPEYSKHYFTVKQLLHGDGVISNVTLRLHIQNLNYQKM
jgi:hypothetical protein